MLYAILNSFYFTTPWLASIPLLRIASSMSIACPGNGTFSARCHSHFLQLISDKRNFARLLASLPELGDAPIIGRSPVLKARNRVGHLSCLLGCGIMYETTKICSALVTAAGISVGGVKAGCLEGSPQEQLRDHTDYTGYTSSFPTKSQFIFQSLPVSGPEGL